MLAVAARELADGLSMLVVALILISHCCWRPRGASAGRQWSCMLLERRGAVRRLLVAYVTEGYIDEPVRPVLDAPLSLARVAAFGLSAWNPWSSVAPAYARSDTAGETAIRPIGR